MINLIYILLSLLLVGVAAMQNIIWLVVLFVVIFTLRFGTLPLIILAFCLDGYFGAFESVPYFSLAAIVWYMVSELLRLRLRINN